MFRFFHEQNLYQNPKLIHIFATIIHPWSKKTCISFLWILFWYPPLFFASLANSGLIFSLFLYLMKYATPIFFNHHRQTHFIPISFQHLRYLYWLPFWSNESPVSTSSNFKNSLFISLISCFSNLFYHTQGRTIFYRI